MDMYGDSGGGGNVILTLNNGHTLTYSKQLDQNDIEFLFSKKGSGKLKTGEVRAVFPRSPRSTPDTCSPTSSDTNSPNRHDETPLSPQLLPLAGQMIFHLDSNRSHHKAAWPHITALRCQIGQLAGVDAIYVAGSSYLGLSKVECEVEMRVARLEHLLRISTALAASPDFGELTRRRDTILVMQSTGSAGGSTPKRTVLGYKLAFDHNDNVLKNNDGFPIVGETTADENGDEMVDSSSNNKPLVGFNLLDSDGSRITGADGEPLLAYSINGTKADGSFTANGANGLVIPDSAGIPLKATDVASVTGFGDKKPFALITKDGKILQDFRNTPILAGALTDVTLTPIRNAPVRGFVGPGASPDLRGFGATDLMGNLIMDPAQGVPFVAYGVTNSKLVPMELSGTGTIVLGFPAVKRTGGPVLDSNDKPVLGYAFNAPDGTLLRRADDSLKIGFGMMDSDGEIIKDAAGAPLITYGATPQDGAFVASDIEGRPLQSAAGTKFTFDKLLDFYGDPISGASGLQGFGDVDASGNLSRKFGIIGPDGTALKDASGRAIMVSGFSADSNANTQSNYGPLRGFLSTDGKVYRSQFGQTLRGFHVVDEQGSIIMDNSGTEPLLAYGISDEPSQTPIFGFPARREDGRSIINSDKKPLIGYAFLGTEGSIVSDVNGSPRVGFGTVDADGTMMRDSLGRPLIAYSSTDLKDDGSFIPQNYDGQQFSHATEEAKRAFGLIDFYNDRVTNVNAVPGFGDINARGQLVKSGTGTGAGTTVAGADVTGGVSTTTGPLIQPEASMNCLDVIAVSTRGSRSRFEDKFRFDMSSPLSDVVWGGRYSLTAAVATKEGGFTRAVFRRKLIGLDTFDTFIGQQPLRIVVWKTGEEHRATDVVLDYVIPPEAFGAGAKRITIVGTMRMARQWDVKLDDENSVTYTTLKKDFESKASRYLSQNLPTASGLVVTGFSPGSVIVHYNVTLDTPAEGKIDAVAQLRHTLIEMSGSADFKEFLITDADFLETTEEVASGSGAVPPTGGSVSDTGKTASDTDMNWLIVGVIIGLVCFCLMLALIRLFYVFCRNRDSLHLVEHKTEFSSYGNNGGIREVSMTNYGFDENPTMAKQHPLQTIDAGVPPPQQPKSDLAYQKPSSGQQENSVMVATHGDNVTYTNETESDVVYQNGAYDSGSLTSSERQYESGLI